ncbi:nuclear mRNA export, poly(A)+RNA binding protein, partial [Cladochytrium tenue]
MSLGLPNRPGDAMGAAIPTLTAVLQSRYDPNNKFLNLDNLESDPGMTSHPALAGFGGDSLETSKIGPVLCKLIGQLFPDYCMLLQNLSFRDNLIQSYRDIDCLKGAELKNLREIMFSGNPVRARETKRPGGELEYRNKIKQLFPSIQILDQEGFEDEISIPVAEASADVLPETEKGSFLDTTLTADMVQDFLPKFFQLFDKDRPALLQLYAEQAQFSLSVNMDPR